MSDITKMTNTKDTTQNTLGDSPSPAVKATLRHNITTLQTAFGLPDDPLSLLIAGDDATLHKIKNTGDITPAQITRLCHIFGIIPHDLLFASLTTPPDFKQEVITENLTDSLTNDHHTLRLIADVAHIQQAKDKDTLCYLARRLRGDPQNNPRNDLCDDPAHTPDQTEAT